MEFTLRDYPSSFPSFLSMTSVLPGLHSSLLWPSGFPSDMWLLVMYTTLIDDCAISLLWIWVSSISSAAQSDLSVYSSLSFAFSLSLTFIFYVFLCLSLLSIPSIHISLFLSFSFSHPLSICFSVYVSLCHFCIFSLSF